MATLPQLVGGGNLGAIDTVYEAFSDDTSHTRSFALTDVPTDFLSMDTGLTWTVRSRLEINQLLSDDTYSLNIRIVSGATILAAAASSGTFANVTVHQGGNTSPTTFGPTAFGYVNTAATEAQWNAATVELQQVHNRNMGGDTCHIQVDFAGFDGTYTAATLPVANAGTDQTVTAGDTVTLDGSASTDTDTYAWTVTDAAGTGLISADIGAHAVDIPGSASTHHVSTPDSAALSVTGDIDIRIKLSLDNGFTNGTIDAFVGKYDATANAQRAYYFRKASTNQLQFFTSSDGIEDVSATAPVQPTMAAGEVKWLRVTRDVNDGAGNYVTTFYESADGVTWSQLGDPVTLAGATSIFDASCSLSVGARDGDNGGSTMHGQVYYAEVRDGIGGSIVASPDFDGQYQGTTSFADAQGNTWTLNTGTELVYLDGAAPSFVAPEVESQSVVTIQLEATNANGSDTDTMALTVDPGAAQPVAITANHAEIDVTGQAVTPTTAALAVTASHATVAVTAQPVTPVLAPVEVATSHATINVAAQPVEAVTAVLVTASHATINVTAQPVEAVTAVLVAASHATITVAGQAAAPVVAPLAVTAGHADIAVTAQPVTPVVAPLEVSTGHATVTVTAQAPATALTPLAVSASHATATVTAQPVTPTVAPLTVAASHATITVAGQAAAAELGAYTLATGHASLVVEAQPVTSGAAAPPVEVTAAHASITVASQETTPTVAPLTVTASHADVTAAAQPVVVDTAPLEQTTAHATVTVAAQAVTPVVAGEPVAVPAAHASITAVAQPVELDQGAHTHTASHATVTVAAQPAAVEPAALAVAAGHGQVTVAAQTVAPVVGVPITTGHATVTVAAQPVTVEVADAGPQINTSHATVTVEAQPVAVVTGAYTTAASHATVTVTAQPVTVVRGAVVVEAAPAVVALAAQAVTIGLAAKNVPTAAAALLVAAQAVAVQAISGAGPRASRTLAIGARPRDRIVASPRRTVVIDPTRTTTT